jgi:hypothetical protein
VADQSKMCANGCGTDVSVPTNYAIHRDGFCQGPEVALCRACGHFKEPSLPDIWKSIERQKREGRTEWPVLT